MRPRNEPEPEPGDLFRPSTDQANREPKTTAVPQTSAPRPGDQSGPKGDRTTLVPKVQPPVPGKPAEPARPVPVDATTKVSPVRPPNGGGADQQDGGREGQDRGGRSDASNGGSTGAERADRSASASRSG
jgi:syndecan 1